MTSSTKPDVGPIHNVSQRQRYQKRTESRPKATCTKKSWSFAVWFWDKRADRQTSKHVLITVVYLRTAEQIQRIQPPSWDRWNKGKHGGQWSSVGLCRVPPPFHILGSNGLNDVTEPLILTILFLALLAILLGQFKSFDIVSWYHCYY